MTRLSVIVPTHDTRELTLRCLERLRSNAPPDAEILLVDDGSTDGTAAAVARAAPAVRILRLVSPQGFSAAVTRGLEQARGEIVLLLNSDTEVLAGLDDLVELFERHPGLGIAGGQLLNADGTAQWSGGPAPTLLWLFSLTSGAATWLRRHSRSYRRLRPLAVQGDDRGRGLVPVDWVPGAALAARRSLIEELHGLELSFRFFCQDLDLCLRARARGNEVAIAPALRVLHHHGGSGGTAPLLAEHGGRLPVLCEDLLLWAQLRRPAWWAGLARRLMLAGVRCRLQVRGLGPAGSASPDTAAWQIVARSLGRAPRRARAAHPQTPPASGSALDRQADGRRGGPGIR